MELLIVGGLIWFVIWLINKVNESSELNRLRRSLPPEDRKAFDEALRGEAPSPMRGFEVRIRKDRIAGAESNTDVRLVECRGLFPVRKKTDVRFVISAFDKQSDRELEPILSAVEEFQEPDSPCYQCVREVPELKPNYGFNDWVPIGVLFPEFLVAPYGGKRHILVIVRMTDAARSHTVHHGFHSEKDESIIWQNNLSLHIILPQKGYIESREAQRSAQILAVKLAVAVALADGHADPKEGKIVRQWMKRRLDMTPKEVEPDLREQFNNAVKEVQRNHKGGKFALRTICDELNQLELSTAKYEAIELCHDVMVADGVADTQELQLLDRIAHRMDLDPKKVAAIRDKRMADLDVQAQSKEDLSRLLGIQPTWDTDTIRAHLRKEFAKWNSRLNSLPEGEKREKAQTMLELIAQERKKYG